MQPTRLVWYADMFPRRSLHEVCLCCTMLERATCEVKPPTVQGISHWRAGLARARDNVGVRGTLESLALQTSLLFSCAASSSTELFCRESRTSCPITPAASHEPRPIARSTVICTSDNVATPVVKLLSDTCSTTVMCRFDLNGHRGTRIRSCLIVRTRE